MGHGMLHRNGKIDDSLLVGGGLPHIQYGIANLQSIFRLCSRKALGTVLKEIISSCLIRQLLEKLRSLHGNFQNLLLGLVEHLLTLCHGGGIVHMDHGLFCSLKGLKGLADNVLSGLSKYLDGHIVRNKLLLN